MELSAAEDQCQTLRNDLDSSEVSKDELVKKAWDARDAAVQRKNASEIELAKERVNCIQVRIYKKASEASKFFSHVFSSLYEVYITHAKFHLNRSKGSGVIGRLLIEK